MVVLLAALTSPLAACVVPNVGGAIDATTWSRRPLGERIRELFARF
ncbi:MAG: hypothetical protein KGI92_05115 [Alphaproteobacteria bacterium]|nr:hypothetical protein [Alphaproteobacteria bacterium]